MLAITPINYIDHWEDWAIPNKTGKMGRNRKTYDKFISRIDYILTSQKIEKYNPTRISEHILFYHSILIGGVTIVIQVIGVSNSADLGVFLLDAHFFPSDIEGPPKSRNPMQSIDIRYDPNQLAPGNMLLGKG